MKFKLIIFFSVLFILASACSRKENGTVRSETTDKIKDSVILTEKQRKVVDGAKKCLNDKFSYDMQMAYHVLTYKDGINTGKAVYPEGDLEPALGVCTDVTIRALRYAGLYDLQKEIHEDINSDWNDYPMKRWGAKKSDKNIDHRRVPNQLIWFKKHFQEVSENGIMPGDIVVWDMNNDDWSDHIGIISDKIESGKYMVIHNFPSPGYVAEENVLNRWSITGIFRIK